MSAPQAALLMVQNNDPYFDDVVLLCHADSESANTWVNSCPRGTTITDSGNCNRSTSTYKWPAGSANIVGAGGRLNSASNADYNFGTNDWTLEFWVNPTTLNLDFNSVKIYYDSRNAAVAAQFVPIVAADANNGVIKYYSNSVERINGGTVMVAGEWQHIAVSRVSGTTRMFRNGVQIGSDYTDSSTYVQCQISVGSAGNTAGSCIGFFDDVRVTNGTGRYAANFVPPWGPFPNF